MEHVEALLTRKSLTARDLKEILPTVWWTAASTTNDPRISETGHASGVKVGFAEVMALALAFLCRISFSRGTMYPAMLCHADIGSQAQLPDILYFGNYNECDSKSDLFAE